MKKAVQSILFFILIFWLFLNSIDIYAQGQEEIIRNTVKKESIKSILLYRDGWRLSYPIIDLNAGVSLVLKFDDLDSEIKNYQFKIVHCDSDWKVSGLSESEYMEGYYQNQIEDYNYSFNTYTSYIHYTLKLPNEEIFFKISGNYAIIVYEDFDEDNIAFIKRFMVAEKLVNIVANVQRPVLSIYRDNSQQINFNIECGSLKIDDPFNDIVVHILQNGRWDNAITDLKPLFNRNGTLIYDYQQENVFPGGSEFRWFDIKSMRYQSPYIKSVEFIDNLHVATLFPAENRADKLYFYNQDLNGKFYPEIQEEDNNDTDADYIQVKFSLPYDVPMADGDFYILGGLGNWLMNDASKMEYDFSAKSYKKQLLLKQGYYNYFYAFKAFNEEAGDLQYTEGNHYETENDYVILVYQRQNYSRYEKLIGFQIVNSLNK